MIKEATMESVSFSIAPDISPQHLPTWHLFVSYLQREMGVIIKVLNYHSFIEQKEALNEGKIDLLYANPYDTGWLIREKNFVGIALPNNQVAEVTIISRKGGPYAKVEDLGTKCTVSATVNADLRSLGTILLEPANLTRDDITFIDTPNHILAIKSMLNGDTDIAMLPTKTYDALSSIITQKIQHLVSTNPKDIETVTHCFVLSPEHRKYADQIKKILSHMHETKNGKPLLDDLNIDSWKILDNPEDITFMIDLIYTLQI